MSCLTSGFCFPDTGYKGDNVLSLELRFLPGENLSHKEMVEKYERTVNWDILNRLYELVLFSRLLKKCHLFQNFFRG